MSAQGQGQGPGAYPASSPAPESSKAKAVEESLKKQGKRPVIEEEGPKPLKPPTIDEIRYDTKLTNLNATVVRQMLSLCEERGIPVPERGSTSKRLQAVLEEDIPPTPSIHSETSHISHEASNTSQIAPAAPIKNPINFKIEPIPDFRANPINFKFDPNFPPHPIHQNVSSYQQEPGTQFQADFARTQSQPDFARNSQPTQPSRQPQRSQSQQPQFGQGGQGGGGGGGPPNPYNGGFARDPDRNQGREGRSHDRGRGGGNGLPGPPGPPLGGDPEDP
ncbi:hypothetical protein Vi05172_g5624 [Venturia inaequalis]|nr:hypothetical protein Vi05172_g5624 [Venturia inaequalis]